MYVQAGLDIQVNRKKYLGFVGLVDVRSSWPGHPS